MASFCCPLSFLNWSDEEEAGLVLSGIGPDNSSVILVITFNMKSGIQSRVDKGIFVVVL